MSNELNDLQEQLKNQVQVNNELSDKITKYHILIGIVFIACIFLLIHKFK